MLFKGLNPQQLRGTRTGVYIGHNHMAMPNGYPKELQIDSRGSLLDSALWITGTAKNMYANRISFTFDFKGPSFVVDTACSSSLIAFDLAVTDMRLGKCDMAIVGTAQLNLQPFTNFIFQTNHFNAADGISKVWDKDADGFVRSEAIACVLLQKKSQAKRIYATVVHSKTNVDGYKKSGNFFPSKELQQTLLEETYIEAGIDPNDIEYFEAHGTGTKAGDPEEAQAIANAYCKNRKGKLLIGLVKSNIGHGEGTSGLASITKTIIAFENKCIPANLNLKTIKPAIAKLCPPLEPVNQNTPFEPNYCAINSFGLGGANAHTILQANKKQLTPQSLLIADKIPRLMNYCGRTQEAVDFVFDFIEKNPSKVTRDFLGLLSDTVKFTQNLNSAGFPFRGSIIIEQKGVNEDGSIAYNYSRETSRMFGLTKPIWFFFSGMGSQWIGMGKSLMAIDKFAESINKCADVLKQFKVDLHDILLSEDEKALSSIVNPFVAITAVQIALFDVLNEIGIQPEKIIGHSFGEISCAYADGCLTLEQTMLCSFWRGKVVEDSNIPSGKMAAVGLSWEEAIKKCPKNVYVACDNAHDSVTISGLEEDTNAFLEKLKSENVFVRDVIGYNLKPYHTNHLKPVADILTKLLKKVIPNPKRRSNKWLSTSVPVSNWEDELAQYASAEYFVNNLVKPVLFTSTLGQAPADAIVIEIAPHALFASLIKRTLEAVNYVGLMKRKNDQHNLQFFLSSIGKLYQLGLNPSIERLYPKVEWPVARGTQSISSLIKWDHNESYFVKKFPEYFFPATSSDMIYEFSLDDPDDIFLQDHVIDGKVIFPATGYLMVAWRRLAAQKGLQWNQFTVVFENVQFRRSVSFQNGKVKLTVRYTEPTGEFLVLDSGHIAAYGKVFPDKEGQALQLQHFTQNFDSFDQQNQSDFKLNTQEFYRELRIRGYDYGPKFQGVQESKFIDSSKSIGKIRYTNNSNFISSLDSMMQLMISAIPVRSLFIPVSIQSFKCDPLMFMEGIDQHKTYTIKKGEDKLKDEFMDDEKEIMKNEEFKDDLIEYKDDIGKLISDFHDKTGTGKQKWYSDVPVFINIKLRALIARGIEIRGLIAVNLPRKFMSNGLRFEKYEFVPYYEQNAIENYNRNELITYLNVCTAICKQILEKTKFNFKTDGFTNNLKNIQINQKIIDEMTMEISEEHTLLNSLYSVLGNVNDVNKNVIECNELADDLREKSQKFEFDVTKDIVNLVGKNERLIRPLLDTVNENVNPLKELRVLEINATNGIIGVDIAQLLVETFIVPIAVEYTIAHNDPEKIKTLKELENIGDYNIVEWIHFNSDFPENVKDSVNFIIHRDSYQLWDIDLNNYFSSALKLLKENGFLLAVFRSKITAPEIIYNELIENENVPNEKQLLERIETFEKTAFENGFKMISKKTDSLLFTAILFRRINKKIQPNEQSIVEVKVGHFEDWLEQLKELIQDHRTKGENANIWLHAHDSDINGIIGLTQCLRLESGGDKLRYIFDMDNKLPKTIDFNKSPFKEILESNLVMNVFKENNYGSFKHLNLPKNYDQTETNEAYASVMQMGDLSSLQWFDGRNLKNPLIATPLKEVQQKDVDIYYSPLNFRDVMMATGRIATGPEGAVIEGFMGLEFAGRRRDTGERVFGMSLCFGIATETKTHEPLLIKIPDQWSMEDAATVCTVYMTCWYGLIERGQLQEGESILIHSGTGGVGQAAINICQYYKCKIFTTVSTQEKRDFLKNHFGLTDDQIFYSRDTDFEENILEATNGNGVDLVLNSLAEDKLLASFRCVGDDGRFIEIGKYDFQMNNPLPMFAFIKNITFHGVALDKISFLQKKSHLILFKKFEKWLYDGVEKGFVKPLNRTIFKPEQVKEAFKYMMTGKHIGKVMIQIRDEEENRKPLKASPVKLIAATKSWFDPNKVYIIIGGLGGMGIEMIYWMMLRGAEKVLVTSRSGIKTNNQRLFFKQLDELGKFMDSLKIQVKVSTQNVIDEQNAKNVLDEAESMGGKIGGIFQLAMVLHDALFESQTTETFDSVCKPKIDATINLDKLTRQLSYKIDYFVTFSSIVSGRGNTGQSPYGYANSVMERICEKRKRDGLHGLAIQWGGIGDVGAVADTFDEERIKMAGLLLHRLPSWIHSLDKYLQCPYPVVASLIRMDKQFKLRSAEENVIKHFWSSLGIDPKRVPNHVTLGELGMESFVAVELQQRLERDYDISLSLDEIKRITVGEMKEFERGNKDKIKQYADDIKIAKENLSKIKFELTNEPVTKLNDVTTGKPIYILPPIESIYHHLIPLAKLLPFPVYGLNWTFEMEELKGIKEIALHYTNLMKTLEPNGNYTLLTTTFGSVVALRMAYKKAPIKKLFVIDTLLIKEAFLQDTEGHELFEQGLRFIRRNVPQLFHDRLRDEIYKIKGGEEEKMNRFIQSLKRMCSSSNSKDLDVIIKGTLKKAKLMKEVKDKYMKKMKKASENNIKHKLAKDKLDKRIKSELVIIRSCDSLDEQKSQEFQEKLFQTYGINKEVSEFNEFSKSNL